MISRHLGRARAESARVTIRLGAVLVTCSILVVSWRSILRLLLQIVSRTGVVEAVTILMFTLPRVTCCRLGTACWVLVLVLLTTV